ncbi:cytochrome P450 [Atractiella rhizophila]|nr:cytochrome P450 [Atractiella rhizophila]
MWLTLLLAALLILSTAIYRRFTSANFTDQIPYAYSPSSPSHSFLARLKAAQEYSTDPVPFLQAQRARLGDVFCVDLIATRIVFFAGEKWTERVLRADEGSLSFDEMIRLMVGGEIGKALDVRAFCDPLPKIIRNGLLSSTRIQDTLSHSSPDLQSNLSAWANASAIPLFSSLNRVIGHIFIRFFLGSSFASEHGDEALSYVRELVDALQSPVFVACPQILRPFTPPGRRLQKALDGMRALVKEQIADYYDGKGEGKEKEERTDYFWYIVQMYDREVADENFGAHFITMIFGAMANLPLTVFWLMIHLSQNSNDLEKLRLELLAVEQEEQEKTPFLDACLREIGRMYANLQLARLSSGSSTTNFFNYHLPPNTMVACSPLLTHYDPNLFDSPKTFNPSRHIASTQNGTSSLQKSAIIQFSLGPHACPGEKLAKAVLKEAMTQLLKYEWTLVEVEGRGAIVGRDGIDVKAEWVRRNLGTPEPTEDVVVQVSRKE